ncbi:hypothetical protein ACTHQT_09190 [Cytobacillus praedii]
MNIAMTMGIKTKILFPNLNLIIEIEYPQRIKTKHADISMISKIMYIKTPRYILFKSLEVIS